MGCAVASARPVASARVRDGETIHVVEGLVLARTTL